ncbi:MAG: retropepsin-like aspartic protease [Candidatus Zixiibacteriota bacterium]
MRLSLVSFVTGFLVTLASHLVGAVIPFDPSRGLVIVEVTINGNITARFGLDTGADHLYIDKSFAEKYGLKGEAGAPERKVTGIDGSSEARTIALRSLEIADLPMMVSVPATMIDIAALSKEGKEDHPDGLIGQNILQQYFVTVDYPQKSIELRSDMPHSLAGKRYETIQFRQLRHLVLVDVSLNGDTTVPMILDYCASYTAVSEQLASKLHLTPDERNLVTLDSVQLGESARSAGVRAVVSNLDSFKKAAPQASFEGILGGTFLVDHTITIDYRRKVIYVHQ